jgi:hypothetical protein
MAPPRRTSDTGNVPAGGSRSGALRQLRGTANRQPQEERGSWRGKDSPRSFHIIVNETQRVVQLFCEGKLHGSIEPGGHLYVGELCVATSWQWVGWCGQFVMP